MLTVDLSRWMPYSADALYEALTDPYSMAAVVGRISNVEIVEEAGDQGRVAVQIDLPLKQVMNTTGDVSGVPGEKITFQTYDPMPMGFVWRFSPEMRNGQRGTLVYGSLNFDLSRFGIPVSGVLIKGIISSELNEDMNRLEAFMAQRNA